jgi:uncharacterized protein with NRDE domain
VLLRFAPGTAWPLLLGAVRDEFADRAWDPPARHWGGTLIGGRDRVAGGTWLAVDPAAPAMAALLNGPLLPVPPDGFRPSRGDLPLSALTRWPAAEPPPDAEPPPHPQPPLPERAELARYNGFHLLRAATDRIDVWSWDGADMTHRSLDPGDHVIVNAGVDVDTPLVDRLRKRMASLSTPALGPGRSTGDAWDGWVDLLGGDGIDPGDPRALLVWREYEGRVYRSGSACLVALGANGVRFDFTAIDFTGPAATGASWYEVPV